MATVSAGVPEPADILLWQCYIHSRSAELRLALILRYLPYARKVAAHLHGRHLRCEASVEDYIQWACVGLMEAFDHFQLNRGAQFTTYALPRMLGAIRDGLETITGRWQEFAVAPEDMETLVSAEAEGPDQVGVELERRQMRLRLHGLLKHLTAREESVLRLHYLQGWSFKEIGQDLGITKGRVSQLHGQALERLRQLLAQVPRHDAFL